MKSISVSILNHSSMDIPRHVLMRLCAVAEDLAHKRNLRSSLLHILITRRKGTYQKCIQLSASDVLKNAAHTDLLKSMVESSWNLQALNKIPDKQIQFINNKNPAKVLLFNNIIGDPFFPEKSQASWVLASALRNAGVPVIFSNSYLDLQNLEDPIRNKNSLKQILRTERPGIVGISLMESYFEAAKALTDFIHEHSNAFIIVGGIMPTITPAHVFAHIPGVHMAVRGAGEIVLPQIAHILGEHTPGSTLAPREIARLASLQGVLFQTGPHFFSLRIKESSLVEDLNSVPLDFSIIEKEDVQKGLTLMTSRGCMNACRFCSLPIKGRYFYRTGKNIFSLLADYSQRLAQLFDGANNVPDYARAINFCDEDFLGDPDRAADVFSRFKGSMFKLTSLEASVNSFFKKESEELNQKLLSSMDPDIFLLSYRTKNLPAWLHDSYFNPYPINPFIQLGTESFCDNTLQYLGKGHTTAQVKKLTHALACKGIYHTHYVIASNMFTRPDEILESLMEIVRLKLIYGRYFMIREPIVKKLVSYQPTPTYREITRKGLAQHLDIRKTLCIPGFPEWDYNLVEADNPINPITRAIVENIDNIFEHDEFFMDTFKHLEQFLINRFQAEDFQQQHVREISAVKKQLGSSYGILANSLREKASVLQTIRTQHPQQAQIFTEDIKQLQVYLGYKAQNVARLNLILTHMCQLRCRYCDIVKSNVKMPPNVIEACLRMLIKTQRPEFKVMFFGVEPLLAWRVLTSCVDQCERIRLDTGKRISYYLTTNCMALTHKKLDFIEAHNFEMEISLDGTPETQLKNRVPFHRGADSYKNIFRHRDRLVNMKIPLHVIMVTQPDSVHTFYDDFKHIVDLGFRRIQINFSVNRMWDRKHMRTFAEHLHRIGEDYFFNKDCHVELVNAASWEGKLYLYNNEVTIDCDGTIYSGNSFLVNAEHARTLIMGSVLNTEESIDYFEKHRVPYDNIERTAASLPVMQSNWKMERIMSSFIKKHLDMMRGNA